ncbi:MAG: hypothetical protein AB7K52_14540 [Phycisphaerales bacterium]
MRQLTVQTLARVAAVCLWVAPSALLAQERTVEQGIAFRTVRAAGNVPYDGGPLSENTGRGTVNQDYRIGETEVTVGQWVEFVRAYAPHWTSGGGDAEANGLVGLWVRYDGNGQYHAVTGSENFPADMSWRMAARFCSQPG